MRFLTRSGRLTAALLLAAVLAVAPAQAATITVDSSADDGTGGCTLREAVTSANTNTPVGGCVAGDDTNDTIVFDSGVTFIQLIDQSVPPLGAGLVGEQIVITEALTITGNGATSTTISGAAGFRVFEVQGTEAVAFNGLTITSAGSTSASGYPTDGGGIYISGSADVTTSGAVLSDHIVSGSGGAVWVSASGSFAANGSTFEGNRARGDASTQGGGAIYTDGGAVSAEETMFTDNRALGTSGSGGAILNPNGATLTIDPGGFVSNRAQRAGGAIETVGGTVTISGSFFTGNNAGANPGNGGAIHAAGGGTVTITGGTASENRAIEGGAYWVGSGTTLDLTGDSDVSDNFAMGAASDQGGGGIYVDGGTLTVTGGAISDNAASGASGSGGGVFVNGGSATLSGVSVQRNGASRAGGGIESLGQTNVTLLTGTALTGNTTGSAPGNGGGLHVSGPGFVTLGDVTVSNNRAQNEGGGLWNSGTGAMSVVRSTVSQNRAPRGGGLFQQAAPAPPQPSEATLKSGIPNGMSIRESLIYANNAGFGGGLYADFQVSVVNTTVAGNEARFGGGVFSDEAFVSFDSATIARNAARTSGGGLYNTDPNNGGERFVSLTNTIVAENTANASGPNLQGRYASEDYNLLSTTPSAATFAPQANDQLGADPLLEMLADNGGPTETLALGAGSPALDAGDTGLTVDQRGEPRSDGSDDIGAFEAAAAPTTALVITGVIDGPLSGGLPKAIELYVLEDIADLSAYGIGVANNGGGTDGEEFTFPDDAATAGDFIYATNSADGFLTWFGFAADYEDNAIDSNGDDAYELFFNGEVVDIIGDIAADGTGLAWEYLDGWAYRDDATGPDGSTFTIGNWSFSGPNALDGESTNATAETPFPTGTYSPLEDANRTAPVLATAAEPVRLDAVTPNPFSLRATTSFSVAEAQTVTVALYDVMGRRVQTLYAGTAQAASPVQVSVDASALASGVYVLVLEGETVRTTRPITVAR